MKFIIGLIMIALVLGVFYMVGRGFYRLAEKTWDITKIDDELIPDKPHLTSLLTGAMLVVIGWFVSMMGWLLLKIVYWIIISVGGLII